MCFFFLRVCEVDTSAVETRLYKLRVISIFRSHVLLYCVYGKHVLSKWCTIMVCNGTTVVLAVSDFRRTVSEKKVLKK